MASIVLGSLGSLVGGPIGGMLGGAAGSLLDNMLLNHKHINKPSFLDLLVEASTMGLPIPAVYGRAKVAGNLIMSNNLQPEKHGGKGGLSGGKGQPYYTYNVSCAVAICRGPIKNIWRIFADSKLIWDMDPLENVAGAGTSHPGTPLVMSAFTPDGVSGGVATLYHYGTGKHHNQQFAGASVSFHYGTEDQLPDSDMEVIAQQLNFNRPNSCPGYRGLAYAVFHGLPLANFGNRIPNFTFEVNGYATPQNIVTNPVPSPTLGPISGKIYVNPIQNVIWLVNQNELQAYNSQTCAIISNIGDVSAVPAVAQHLSSGGLNTNPLFNNAQTGPDQSFWYSASCNNTAGTGGLIINWDLLAGCLGAYPLQRNAIGPRDTAAFVTPYLRLQPLSGAIVVGPTQQPFGGGAGSSAYCGSSDCFVVFDIGGRFQVYYAVSNTNPVLQDTNALDQTLELIAWGDLQFNDGTHSFGHPRLSLAWSDSRQQLVCLDGQAGGAQFILDLSDRTNVKLLGPQFLDNLIPTANPYRVMYDVSSDRFIYCNKLHVYSVQDPTAGVLAPNAHLDVAATYAGAQLIDELGFQTQQLGQGSYVLALTDNTIHYVDGQTLLDLGLSWSFSAVSGAVGNIFYNPLGAGAINYTTFTAGAGIGLYSNPSGGPLSLSEVVTDICSDVGLPVATALDTSALVADKVPGYAVTSQASGRAAIEPLQEVYLFDLVESNFKLVARKRLVQTQNVNVTIDEHDLGARAAAAQPGDNPAPKVVETVKQDFDLPQFVFMRYKSTSGDFFVKDFSFQLGTQYAKRAVACVGSTAHLTLNTPLLLTDSQASAVVYNILFLHYINRTSVSFSLPIKYMALEAGDVVKLSWTDTEGNNVSYPVYITQVDLGVDNTLHYQGVTTDPAVFAAGPPGQSPIAIANPIHTGTPTTLLIAETPPLRDSDDSAGLYIGACSIGLSTGWGASILRSTDGALSFTNIAGITTPAAIGVAQTALGTAGNPVAGVWDKTNQVTLTLIGGNPLAGVTPLQVLDKQNVFLIGKEIVGVSNVVQNADGSYTLSLLQRGMLGTDIFMNTHVAGERTMLLSTDGSVQDVDMSAGQIGLQYVYAGVSIGSDLTSSTKQNYSLEGSRIRPEAASHASLQRDASNNVSITWNPRNRINYEWLDGQEQGSDESAEAYEVDILGPDGAVVRVITDFSRGLATIGNTTGADTGIRLAQYTAAQQAADGLVGAGETWSPTDNGGLTLSGFNLIAANSTTSLCSVRALGGALLGSYYFEVQPSSLSSNDTAIGLADNTFALTGTHLGSDTHGVGSRAIGGIFLNGVNVGGGSGLTNGQWTGVAVNLNSKRLWIRNTATALWNGNPLADPATGAGGIDISAMIFPLFPCFSSAGHGEQAVANFGATTFAGAIPPGFSTGFPGPNPPIVTANIYQLSTRVGRGFPRMIVG